MKTYIFSLIIFLLLFSDICFSQQNGYLNVSLEKNQKRYELESGQLKYNVYSVKKKNGKRDKKIYQVVVDFSEFGKIQDIKIIRNDTIETFRVIGDSIVSNSRSDFYLNYFVYDYQSVYNKGIQLIKPDEIRFRRHNCLRFVQYYFVDLKAKWNSGSVIYYKKIPVRILGPDFEHNGGFIWKLLEFPK
ncbi:MULTISPECIES: hypothetical protein [unclassified Paraflavitalea]|uniref:hypothetical protein n=1 Tax=unclassified Paraflavitalea TaxID=2798305 RepID=UPI003D34093B